MGRAKKAGKRTPSGQLSRAGKQAMRAVPLVEIARERDAYLADRGDPLWGSGIGKMHLTGKISLAELESGRRWFNMLAAYYSAIGAKDIKSACLEVGVGGHEPDPDSDLGVELAAKEKSIVDEYQRTLSAIGSASPANRALRMLYRDDYLDFQELAYAISGLKALSIYYRLTQIQ